MNTATLKSVTTKSATLDHRTGSIFAGAPASRYHRVLRPQASAPNYAARRIGALFVAVSAVMAGVWMVEQAADGFGGTPVVAADSLVESGTQDAVAHVHVARDGDSLWSIADEHRGGVDRDRYVDALVTLNGGTAVALGQAIRLP